MIMTTQIIFLGRWGRGHLTSRHLMTSRCHYRFRLASSTLEALADPFWKQSFQGLASPCSYLLCKLNWDLLWVFPNEFEKEVFRFQPSLNTFLTPIINMLGVFPIFLCFFTLKFSTKNPERLQCFVQALASWISKISYNSSSSLGSSLSLFFPAVVVFVLPFVFFLLLPVFFFLPLAYWIEDLYRSDC